MAATKSSRTTLHSVNFSEQPHTHERFEKTEFVNCIFPGLTDLSFADCVFINCNLSNLKTSNSRFQNVSFMDCKLLGLSFSGAIDFALELHFENCNMDYVSFDRKKINKSRFKNCRLHNANFTSADLSKSTFIACDFYEALFSKTNLNTVDFTSSTNFIIDPELNSIKKAKFLTQQLAGLLYRHDIIIE